MLCDWLLSGGRSMLGTAAPGSGAGRFVDDVPVPGSLEAASCAAPSRIRNRCRGGAPPRANPVRRENVLPSKVIYVSTLSMAVVLSRQGVPIVKYWIDTEFIARPYTIDLISIGLVAEDGRASSMPRAARSTARRQICGR